MEIGMVVTGLSLAIWIGLIGFRGQFWRSDQRLEADAGESSSPLPSICAVIPARNEADLLPLTLRSLLQQEYSGSFTIILVDDHSTDATAIVAKNTAAALGSAQLQVISAAPLPAGWTGKLWAMEQGIGAAEAIEPDYILLTDADIEHDPASLSRLVHKAEQEGLDLASIMVRLRCESFWEKLLIPAFVFFFQKLYPFRWVNDPTRSIAAAAGGCILVRGNVLNQIGSMQAVRQALIDDCALAAAVKLRNPGEKPFGKIWLGLSDRTHSLRPYPTLASIWDMVARTAFTQLGYSPWLLVGTLLGMTLIYLVPPLGLGLGIAVQNGTIALLGLTGWLLMSLAYFPTIRFYRCPLWLALALPAIAFLYTLMTIDSAFRHWQGRGGAWKGRVYK